VDQGAVVGGREAARAVLRSTPTATANARGIHARGDRRSLLRPPRLRTAIDLTSQVLATLAGARSRSVGADRGRDDAIRAAVRRQIDCGLDVITDGEFRRWMFMNSFYDAVDGVRTGKTVAFHNDRGEDVRLNIHEIVGRLAPVDSPGAREAAFMADVAEGYPFKVTFRLRRSSGIR
jgi:5-methyltetrahydropteroyltriglutamate--homocysteine methyltransferase